MEAMHEAKLKDLERIHVDSKSPSRVEDLGKVVTEKEQQEYNRVTPRVVIDLLSREIKRFYYKEPTKQIALVARPVAAPLLWLFSALGASADDKPFSEFLLWPPNCIIIKLS